MIVFTFGKSIPFSITVVERSISYSFLLNERILFSRVSQGSWPWAMIIFLFLNIFQRVSLIVSIVDTLLWIKNNCHHRSNSLFQASAIILLSNLETSVSIGILHAGGVVSILILFIPFKAIFRLLGIGVAESESISIFHLNFLIFSLSFTQNLCSISVFI